jgi:hypothetical protein
MKSPASKKTNHSSKRKKQYKVVKHRQANRLIDKLEKLILEENLCQLNFSTNLIKAVEAQKNRLILAINGVAQCYEKFSNDPNYYIYNIDPVSGTMSPAEPPSQSTKPACRACG